MNSVIVLSIIFGGVCCKFRVECSMVKMMIKWVKLVIMINSSGVIDSIVISVKSWIR